MHANCLLHPPRLEGRKEPDFFEMGEENFNQDYSRREVPADARKRRAIPGYAEPLLKLEMRADRRAFGEQFGMCN